LLLSVAAKQHRLGVVLAQYSSLRMELTVVCPFLLLQSSRKRPTQIAPERRRKKVKIAQHPVSKIF